MKIVFFGTSNVALPILEALSKTQEILAVVTQPDSKIGRKQEIKESPVSILANEMKLKVLKPKSAKKDPNFLNELKSLSAELFVVVSYGQILPLEIINLPKYKTINVHFSLLPKYRGSAPIQYALLNGEEQTGTSIFILDEKVDHGPLLFSQAVKVDPDDNYLTLSEKLAFNSAAVINSVIGDYVSGVIVPVAQNEAEATFTKIINKEQGKIDFNKTAHEIYNKFRAFYPWPGVWTTWNGKMLKITDIAIDTLQKTTESGIPGTVLINGVVVCGNGTFIKIKTLQMEGKKETNIESFLNGYKDFVGALLK